MRVDTTRAKALAQSAGIGPLIVRQLLPMVLMIGAVWVFWDRLQGIDFKHIWAEVSSVRPTAWGVSLVAAMCSFLAIARYDRIIHGILGTGIPNTQARTSGVVAVAAAQFAGFGLLTGTLARWRMIPDLTLRGAIHVTGFVSASFLLGWAGLFALTHFATGAHILPLWGTLAGIFLSLAVLAGPFMPRFWPRRAPGTGAMLAILVTVAVDLLFACLAFWAVLPPDSTLTYSQLLPVFLLATMAGLVCGTPGGIGAFELTLLHFLPEHEQGSILVGALAFRLVYHAIPGLVAGGLLVLGPRGAQPKSTPKRALSPPATHAHRTFAEAGLSRAGSFELTQAACGTQWLCAERPNTLVALTRPVIGSEISMLRAHRAMAASKAKSAIVYRADTRTAHHARRLGWRVLQLGHDPIINPQDWHLNRPANRQLRRLLRQADAAGVRVVAATDRLPFAQMAEIACDWANSHGGERGFCMGRYDPDYVSGQRIWLAWQGQDLVGFVTFHQATAEWTLDLMRHRSSAPRGTMQALICAALIDARTCGLSRVSLAATWRGASRSATRPMDKLESTLNTHFGSPGLIRFKSSFAPVWVPRYVVAPGYAALIVGIWDVFRATAPRNWSQPCRGYIKFYS